MESLFDMFKSQTELAHDRGYFVTDEDVKLYEGTASDFHKFMVETARENEERYRRTRGMEKIEITEKLLLGASRERLGRKYKHKEIKGRTLKISYVSLEDGKTQISKQTLLEVCKDIEENRYSEFILVVNAALSTGANELVQTIVGAIPTDKEEEKNVKTNLENKRTYFQIFKDEEMLFNPVNHKYVPPHELLKKEEEDELLRQFKIERSKMLIIKLKDPIVKHYGWRVNRIVRIRRNDSSVPILTPRSINYRLIVP